MKLSFLEEMFPSRYTCIACRREYGDNSRYGVCNACYKTLAFIEKPCVVCGRESKTPHCLHCRSRRSHFEKARSVFNYEGRMREVYLTYKFGEKTYLAKFFAAFLVDLYRGLGFHCDGVVGIPSYRKKKTKTLNHSELLAKTVADELGLPIVDGLRKKNVRKQVGLDGKDRQENAKGAYYVEGENYKGKVILVIDDIMTTGSTLNSVAKTLREAGAKKVYCLTIFSVASEGAEKDWSGQKALSLDE